MRWRILIFLPMVLSRRGETRGKCGIRGRSCTEGAAACPVPHFLLGGGRLKFFPLCDPVLAVRHASCVSKQPTLDTMAIGPCVEHHGGGGGRLPVGVAGRGYSPWADDCGVLTGCIVYSCQRIVCLETDGKILRRCCVGVRVGDSVQWYLVHSKPHQESVAKLNLQRRDVETFFPQLRQ